jgi:phosphoenolpyruvate carboxykinase (ATP)
VKEVGENFSTSGPENHGFSSLNSVFWNLNQQEIYEIILERGEGKLSKDGAMVVETGIHTGRSAQDKFVVKESANKDEIWWENAKEISEDNFDTLYKDMTDFSNNKDLFVQDLYGGADLQYRLPTRIYTEYAWHSLFIQNLLITVKEEEKPAFDPEFIIIDLPSFKADPNRHGSRSETIIAVNFAKKVVLIAGTSYAGEIKKSVFTMLNFLLPPKNVMPMHCSVNVGNENDSAIFFGLSGTGKTTLSADPKRTLIGDDEHGWSENGVFNFEGGCYAKMIRLSKDAEPEIYETTKKVGTILENVVLNEGTGELDLDDDTLAENTRGAYPLSFIPNSSETGRGPIPKNIILLTCDAFGVLPPIAKLSASQTMYHFLSGYTAKVAGTEKGVTEPEATFSACFGAPFMPRHPSEYGNLLKDLIHKYDVNCWLVNTGWSGGPVGEGDRMPIKATRALLSAALDGTLNSAEMRKDQFFGFEVPLLVDGVDETILVPRNTWSNKDNYDAQATKLVDMFNNNFSIFEKHVDEDIINAAPKINLS